MSSYMTVEMPKVFDINEKFIGGKMRMDISLCFPVSRAERTRVDRNAICWSFGCIPQSD